MITLDARSESGLATDILGGKSVSVHRLGCNDNGTMLPAHPPGELVKGGDMEAMADTGPGQLLSNHHSGPWYAPESGAEQDPLHPGDLRHSAHVLAYLHTHKYTHTHARAHTHAHTHIYAHAHGPCCSAAAGSR